MWFPMPLCFALVAPLLRSMWSCFLKKESKARCEHAGSYRRERKVSGCRVPFEHETHFDYRSAGCFFGKIIESVDSGDMYLSHLPDCAANRSIVSMAYAGLLSAAFEWEFSRAFEDGVAHSDKGRRAKELIHGKLKELRKDIRATGGCMARLNESKGARRGPFAGEAPTLHKKPFARC